MKNTSGFTHWVIIILVSIMAVGFVGAAWYYEENKEEGNYPNVTISLDEFNQGCKTNIDYLQPNWRKCDENIIQQFGCSSNSSWDNIFTEDSRLYYCNASDDRHTGVVGNTIYMLKDGEYITSYYNWDNFIIAYNPSIITKEDAFALTQLAGFSRDYHKPLYDVKIAPVENGFEVSNIFYDYDDLNNCYLSSSTVYKRNSVLVHVSTDGRISILDDKVHTTACPSDSVSTDVIEID